MTLSLLGPVFRCTIQAHPAGGHSPVLHPADRDAARPGETTQKFPTVSEAVAYAYRHYPNVPITVPEPDGSCGTSSVERTSSQAHQQWAVR